MLRGCRCMLQGVRKKWGAQKFSEDSRHQEPTQACSSPSLSAVAIVVGAFHVLIRCNAWRVARSSHQPQTVGVEGGQWANKNS